MEKQLKETVLEIATVVKEFPEPLQARVLEALLNHELSLDFREVSRGKTG
jgi:hypothetical protein